MIRSIDDVWIMTLGVEQFHAACRVMAPRLHERWPDPALVPDETVLELPDGSLAIYAGDLLITTLAPDQWVWSPVAPQRDTTGDTGRAGPPEES